MWCLEGRLSKKSVRHKQDATKKDETVDDTCKRRVWRNFQMRAPSTIAPMTPPTDAPTIVPTLTAMFVSKTFSCPTLSDVSPNLSSWPDLAAVFRRETTSVGLDGAPSMRTNANSTITLPAVTDTMTICFSGTERICDKPVTNAARRSDPSPKVLMDPVRVNTIFSCSSS